MKKDVIGPRAFEKLLRDHYRWLDSDEKKGAKLQLDGAHIEGVSGAFDLRKAVFKNCDFHHVSFVTSQFDGGIFSNCSFRHSAISYSTLEKMILYESSFRNCVMNDLQSSNCTIRDSEFVCVLLNDSDISASDIAPAKFVQCLLTDVSFSESYLGFVEFHSSNLAGADFRDASIHYSSFEKCSLHGASVNKKTRFVGLQEFSIPDLLSMDWSEVKLPKHVVHRLEKYDNTQRKDGDEHVVQLYGLVDDMMKKLRKSREWDGRE